MIGITFLALCILLTKKTIQPEIPKITQNNIEIGIGYSEDSQQLAHQICYNASVSSISDQKNVIKIDNPITSSELEEKLGISVKTNGKIGMFSSDSTSTYLRSIQEKDTTISLNYYKYSSNTVTLQISGIGNKSLTEIGKNFYNNSKNPYFGLLCGDNYISSYDQGALLIITLNIQFKNAIEKKIFEKKFDSSFGNIVTSEQNINKIAIENNISGSITIQAFQLGGDPNQLFELLNIDSNDQDNSLLCNFEKMDKCIHTSRNLYDYAIYNFPKQFSIQNNSKLVPLGIGFTEYNSIDYIDLPLPISLVTSEITKYRNELSCKLKENEYYQQKLYPFANNGYPIKLDAIFIKNVNLILFKANSNVDLLRQTHGGAIDCFNFPNKCKNIKNYLNFRIQNITKNDLKFLENIKYLMTIGTDLLFNTGGNSDNWIVVADNSDNRNITKIKQLLVTENNYSYDLIASILDTSENPIEYEITYNGNLSGNYSNYIGKLCYHKIATSVMNCTDNYIEKKLISSFFFEAYDIPKMCD